MHLSRNPAQCLVENVFTVESLIISRKFVVLSLQVDNQVLDEVPTVNGQIADITLMRFLLSFLSSKKKMICLLLMRLPNLQSHGLSAKFIAQ